MFIKAALFIYTAAIYSIYYIETMYNKSAFKCVYELYVRRDSMLILFNQCGQDLSYASDQSPPTLPAGSPPAGGVSARVGGPGIDSHALSCFVVPWKRTNRNTIKHKVDAIQWTLLSNVSHNTRECSRVSPVGIVFRPCSTSQLSETANPMIDELVMIIDF